MTEYTQGMSRNPFKGMRRFPDDGWVAGVCAGIALHFDWSRKLVRLVAVLLLIFTGFWPTAIAYLVFWYVLDPVQGSAGEAAAAARPAASQAPPGVPPADIGSLKARFGALEQRLRQIEEYVTDQEYELRRELRKLET